LGEKDGDMLDEETAAALVLYRLFCEWTCVRERGQEMIRELEP
jgi:hypothetical protein